MIEPGRARDDTAAPLKASSDAVADDLPGSSFL
jgi:hypothetical protein